MKPEELSGALILAAGRGTRLWPITTNTSKPMVPIAGKPILGHIIDALESAGISRQYVVASPKDLALRRYVEERGKHLILQEKAEGTAKAIELAKDFLKGPFLVASGDHIMDYSIYSDLVSVCDKGKSYVSAKYYNEASRFGVFSIRCGKVAAIKEKPKHVNEGFVNLGIYIFNPLVYKDISKIDKSERGEYEITDILEGMEVFVTVKPWIDVAYPWNLVDALGILLRQEVIVHPSAKIESGATLIPPCYVGEGAIVGEGARVSNSNVGDYSVVEPGTILQDSYLMGNCRVVGKLHGASLAEGARFSGYAEAGVGEVSLNGKSAITSKPVSVIISPGKEVSGNFKGPIVF